MGNARVHKKSVSRVFLMYLLWNPEFIPLLRQQTLGAAFGVLRHLWAISFLLKILIYMCHENGPQSCYM